MYNDFYLQADYKDRSQRFMAQAARDRLAKEIVAQRPASAWRAWLAKSFHVGASTSRGHRSQVA